MKSLTPCLMQSTAASSPSVPVTSKNGMSRPIARRSAKRVETAPTRQAIVGKHNIEDWASRTRMKFVPRFDRRRFDIKARIAELEQNQVDVMG